MKLVSHTEFHMLNIFHMHFTCISHIFHTFAPGYVVLTSVFTISQAVMNGV